MVVNGMSRENEHCLGIASHRPDERVSISEDYDEQ